MAAVVVGIIGSTYISSTKPSDLSLSKTLRKVSVIIFLVVTALLALHTLFLVRQENAALSKSTPSPSLFTDQRLNISPPIQDEVRYRGHPSARRTECTSCA